MAETILLIDDNPVQAVTRQTILRRAGYFVMSALNPARALEQFRGAEFASEVDLVITDHLMPGMTGAEFTRELRKVKAQIPVLVISGLEEAEAEYSGLEVEFRVKPLQPDRLLACVQGMMRRTAGSQSGAGGGMMPQPAVLPSTA